MFAPVHPIPTQASHITVLIAMRHSHKEKTCKEQVWEQ